MFALTDFFDSPGPMAKSAADLLLLMEILLGRNYDGVGPSWEGLSVGFLDPDVWKTGEAMCKQHEGTAEQTVKAATRFSHATYQDADRQ